MKSIKSGTTSMENAIIINTRCIEILRARKGTIHLSEEEYALCDELGWELAKILPADTRINPLHTVTTAQILDWATNGSGSERLTNESGVSRKRGVARVLTNPVVYGTAFILGWSALWVFIIVMIFRVL